MRVNGKWGAVAAIVILVLSFTHCDGKQESATATQSQEAEAETEAVEIEEAEEMVEDTMPEVVEAKPRYRDGVPDTVENIPYRTELCEGMKMPIKHRNMHYDAKRKAMVKPVEYFNFRYADPDTTVLVKVFEVYTFGNGQASVSDVVFAGSDKIVVLSSQASHIIYSAETFKEIGQMPGYINEFEDFSMMAGNEPHLCRANMGIADVLYTNGLLYVVSTGGVIRIYDVDKQKLVHVIVLPPITDEPAQPIDQCWLYPNASCITYTIENGNRAYTCPLPIY